MISFYPGPSRVYPEIPRYVQEAYEAGLLSANHRSPEFVEVSRKVIHLLHERLQIPKDYMIFFTSSATECWEIISQSLVSKESFHFYNGAFGEKWLQYARQLQPAAEGVAFGLEQILPIDYQIDTTAELIAVTHNETSNGTAVSMELIRQLRDRHPDQLIAVDATSSMAGDLLDFSAADVWYASVQKCFGLPAGLAVMVCSPRALQRAAEIGEKGHYNSLLYLQQMIENYQTTYTPNVLGIYLLMRVMEERPGMEQTATQLQKRYQRYKKELENFPFAEMLVKNDEVRSLTVLALQADKKVIDQLRQQGREAGLVLGNGYGAWKETTLRIANFPAILEDEVEKLIDFLKRFSM
ncbi:MAG: aminotransferase class V-fold PLP-dependent enzyme [Cyclobacteriaceae bacterium]